MKDREPYIGGAAGGVPERIFVPGFDDVVEGGSGEYPLKCIVDQRKITIEESRPLGPGPSKPRCILQLSNYTSVLSMDIKTKLRSGQKHPDLYAGRLVRRGIKYFEDQGFSVNKMMGDWKISTDYEPSDNYEQYQAYLRGFKKEEITEEDMKQAARQTRTGQWADSLGFKKIDWVVDDPVLRKSVQVLFSK